MGSPASHVPAPAAVAATLFAIALTVAATRSALKSRRVSLAMWAFAFAQFAVASAALTVGAGPGWNPALFRTYYLFGAVLNVVWLGLGTVWLLAPRRVSIAVTALVVAACLFASIRVLGAPMLSGAEEALSKAVPPSSEIFPTSIRNLSRIFSIGGSVVVLGGLIFSIARRRRQARGLALIAAGIVVVIVGSELGRAGFANPFALALAVGMMTMYFGFKRT